MVNVAWPDVAALVLALILGLFMLMHLLGACTIRRGGLDTSALPGTSGCRTSSAELCRIVSTS